MLQILLMAMPILFMTILILLIAVLTLLVAVLILLMAMQILTLLLSTSQTNIYAYLIYQNILFKLKPMIKYIMQFMGFQILLYLIMND